MTTGPRPNRSAPMPHPDILAGAHRRDENGLPRTVVVLIAALGALAVSVGVYTTSSVGDTEEQAQTAVAQRDAAATQGADLARQVLAACARGEVVPSPTGQDLCQRASLVQSTPVPPVLGEPGPTGEPGRPPTLAEIERAVTDYLVAHPPPAGRPPTETEVAAAVAQYLTAHPPTPGRPPTADEIADAVETYFAANPPPSGAPGRPPTDAEIRSAVDTYLAENPPPRGPRGPAGPTCPDGTTLREVVYADGTRGVGCVLDQQPTPAPTVQPEPTTSEQDPPMQSG